MANTHYYRARAKWALGQLNWQTDDVRGLLVSSAYTVDLAAHEFLSSVGAGARLGAAVALTGKTVVATDGRMTCDQIRFTAMPASGTVAAMVLYKHNASEAAAPLLIYMDTAASGLPLTLDGKDVAVTLPSIGLAIL